MISSKKIQIIEPNKIGTEILDNLQIDLGMRSLVGRLLTHGYDTAFSCEGHGIKEPYIVFRKNTGDGTFEKEAKDYGLRLRPIRECCKNLSKDFCENCGASKTYTVYYRSANYPFSLKT